MQSGNEAGFTYVAALILVAVLSTTLAATGQVWSQMRQREKEAELIWIGAQFTRAIGLYYQRSPGTIKRYPQSLEDLLEDKRYVSRQRYLRRIYRDPITSKIEWGIVLAPDGGIMGVHSLSYGKSIVRAPSYPTASRYRDLRFVYEPRS